MATAAIPTLLPVATADKKGWGSSAFVPDTSFRRSTLDLLQLAESGYTPSQILDVLVAAHPDVSKCVRDAVNISDTPVHLVATNASGQQSATNSSWLSAFCDNLIADPARRDDNFNAAAIWEIRRAFRKSLMLRGAVCCELIVSKRLEPLGIYLRDPDRVSFADDGTPLWSTGIKDIPVNNGRVFYMPFDRSFSDASPVSDILPVLSCIWFQLRVFTDLAQIIKKVGWPRVDIEIIEKVIIDNAPPDIRANPDKLRNYVQSVIAEIKSSYERLNPEDGFVHTDAARISLVESKGGAQSFDVRSLMQVLDQQIVTALKSMPSLLGRSAGKTSTFAQAEIEVYRFYARSLQRAAAAFEARVLTACLNLAGKRGHVLVNYAPIELRSPTEIEQWRSTQITNACASWVMGVVTFDEARSAIRANDGSLPDLDEESRKRAQDFMLARAMNIKAEQQVERSSPATVTEEDQ